MIYQNHDYQKLRLETAKRTNNMFVTICMALFIKRHVFK